MNACCVARIFNSYTHSYAKQNRRRKIGSGVKMRSLIKCNRCGNAKNASFFPKKNRNTHPVCRDCISELRRRNREVSGNTYTSRDKILRDLGFDNYKAYLNSFLWREIRTKVRLQKGSSCFVCGDYATDTHHNRYAKADLTGETINNIIPVCRKCHNDAEHRNGKKNTLRRAKKKLDAMRREANKPPKQDKPIRFGLMRCVAALPPAVPTSAAVSMKSATFPLASALLRRK